MEPIVIPGLDPAHDVLHYGRQALDTIFAPKSVAVIGATEKQGSVGRTILWNLISSPFGGTVYPGQPQAPQRAGHQGLPQHQRRARAGRPGRHRHARHQPSPASSRNASTPACKGAIVISAGFKETGPEGVELERQILEHARRGNMRIIGPNCLGVMSPLSGLNATFAAAHGAPRQRGLHQPERRAVHRRARLEPAARMSASAPSSRSARCSTWAGAT